MCYDHAQEARIWRISKVSYGRNCNKSAKFELIYVSLLAFFPRNKDQIKSQDLLSIFWFATTQPEDRRTCRPSQIGQIFVHTDTKLTTKSANCGQTRITKASFFDIIRVKLCLFWHSVMLRSTKTEIAVRRCSYKANC